MNDTAESVAVVVVTFNSAALLPGLFASLPAGMGELPWQLLVVDNASSDDSIAVTERLQPEAIVVDTGRNGGYAAGINAGVAAAGQHTCVLVLNPDVRLASGCVPTLVRALREPGTGIAAPRLLDGAGLRIDSIRREPSIVRTLADAVLGATRAGRIGELGEIVTRGSYYDDERQVDWAEGSTQLISAECWDACGPWDESYFLYSEETDFGLRARDRGYATRYTPSAQAVHLKGDSRVSPRLWALLTVNRLRLYRRRHNALMAVGFWLALVLRESSRAVLGRSTERASVRALLSIGRLRERPGPWSVHPGAQ